MKIKMGCNCKNKYKSFEEIADGNGDEIDAKKEKLNFPMKILQIFMQLIFGIFCSVVIIIMIVPMLLYIIGCLITGKQAQFKLKKFGKKKN